MTDDVKRAIESKEFVENYDLGALHSECEELKDIKDEALEAMKRYAAIVFEHHKTCPKGEGK